MTRLRPAIAFLALLGATRAVATGDDGRPGRVVMSDGTTAEGRLAFTVGVELHLVDPTTGKGRDVDPDDLVAILFRVDSESLERPFTFTTPGKDEKTYGEGRYPLRNVVSTLVWKTGERAEGHLKTTVVHVLGPAKGDGEDPDDRKVILKRQWKGEVGQTLDDLVFAREVRFTDVADPAAKAPATLDVVVKGAGVPRAAGAFGLGSRLAFAGVVSSDPADGRAGRVRFAGLPSDTYDVAVLSGRQALAGSARTARSAKPIVDAEDLGALAEIVAKGDDLYDARALVATGGDRDAARLTVWKRVMRATTFDADRGRSQALVALDVWTAHRLEHEWRIDGRASLLRVVLEVGEEPPTVTVVPRLAGIPVAPGERAERVVDLTEGTR